MRKLYDVFILIIAVSGAMLFNLYNRTIEGNEIKRFHLKDIQ